MATATQTVREIALEQPTSIRVFERLGIDYCCGGRKPLSEACEARSLEVDAVIAALEAAVARGEQPAEDFTGKTLTGLCAHIVAIHHEHVRRELPRLYALAEKVVNRHGENHPELQVIQVTLRSLAKS